MDYLKCRECASVLPSKPLPICSTCGWGPETVSGKISWLGREGEVEATDPLDSIKSRLKSFPRLYEFMIAAISPVYPFAGKADLKRLLDENSDGVMVNVGSGAHRIHESIVNIDFQAFPEVDIIADATSLPLVDDSVDLIVSIALLEHVREPKLVIAEFLRVLKPGAKCYVGVPFIQGFHASPHDYQRYTSVGLTHQFNSFTEISLSSVGPTSGLIWVLGEWLGMLLSFGSKRLQVLMALAFSVALSPLKFLDSIMRLAPGGDNISSAFILIATKPSN